MAIVDVRTATLDDSHAISDVFRSHIHIWQRVNADGQVEDVAYDHLSIYERWLHGGPWMSVETAAIHLSHLLMGAGIPLVAVRDGQLLAYAEAYHGNEPDPYGDHLHLAHLTLSSGQDDPRLADALIGQLLDIAQTLKCERLTANQVGNDPEADTLYRRHGMFPIARIQRMSIPAKSGQGFYKAVDHPAADAAQIDEWFMPIGRLGSARQQWETFMAAHIRCRAGDCQPTHSPTAFVGCGTRGVPVLPARVISAAQR